MESGTALSLAASAVVMGIDKTGGLCKEEDVWNQAQSYDWQQALLLLVLEVGYANLVGLS